MNKKGGLGSLIAIIILLLIVIILGYIVYKNFHTTCILSNLKSMNFNMTNCVRG